MKKRLLVTLIGLFTLFSVNLIFAQPIPNSGFETWVQSGTFEHPVVTPAPLFMSSNSESFYNHNILTTTKVTGFSGSALRVENKQAPNGDTLPGYAAWGNVSNSQFTKGIPLPGNQPLTGISLYLKYSINPATPGFVAVIPRKNGGFAGAGNGMVPGAYVYPLTGSQSAFTLTNYTFSPALIQNPDSCVVVVASIDFIVTGKATIGNFIEIDQLSWIGNSNILSGGSLDVWQNVPPIETPDKWFVWLDGQNENTFAKSTDALFGNYSMQLHNLPGGNGVRTGSLILGGYNNCGNNGPCNSKPGMELLSTPKSLGFYYKYTTPGVDTANVWLNLYKSGIGIMSSSQYILPSSGWKYANLVINQPGQVPDSVFIIFESGRWQTGVVGSTLKLDGLKFHYCDDASIITGPASVCTGTNGAQFVISEEFASGYTWSTNTGTISGANTNDTITIDGISANGTISVIKSYPDGCPDKQFDFNITVTSAASSNAGPDQSVCANNAVTLMSGSVTGATGGLWSSSGTGSFDDNTSLTASYTPSASDITGGSVTLTLTPTGTGGCSVSTDNMVLSFTAAPTVSAGADQLKCGNNALTTLSGTSASGILWTGGSGTFSNNTSLTSTYTPSVNDVQIGFVALVISTTGNGTCNPARDTMIIVISAVPTVNAGPDQTVCANNPTVNLAGSSTNSSSFTWSGGTGIFAPNNTTLNATYTPSAAEISAGMVTLTGTANRASCISVTDQMMITITPAPTINAGPDQTITGGNNATLAGSFTVATGGIWTTSGTGNFTPNATTANATYSPSAGDITSGSVTLTFTTTGVGNCNPVSDQMTITINPAGISNSTILGELKVYPSPSNGIVSVEVGSGISIAGISLINSYQQELSVKSLELNGNKATLDISELNSGIYFIRISTDRGVSTQKVIKE